ncbi:hypothetical protein ACE193_23340 [Bernardetia sp. OM2101]|uniref:hypothetical protein n=1 Tax=Bernardetia sp. OM2101 TaxID=3344876 RepID=UPI0035CFCDC8
MNNINYYYFIPVLINFILSLIIYGEVVTGRYAIFGIFHYIMLFLIHGVYLMFGSSIHEIEYLQKNQVTKYWIVFNLPMLILVVTIDILLYLYGDLNGKVNDNDIKLFILNNTMLIFWVLSSILFRYKSNYFK